MSKVILITGASSGIGKACSEYLAQRGHTVYGTSRKAMTSDQPNMHFVQMDVTDRQSVIDGVAQIIEQEEHIDVVMNNAGMGIMGSLELATEEEVRLQMDANFHGVVNVCSAVIPYMRKRRSGHVINVSSIGGVMGLPYQGFYSASKFAVEGYSEALSLELHRFGLKVTLIEPGDFNTGFTGNRKLSEATLACEDYSESFRTTLGLVEKEELGGSHPIKIAKAVDKIINKKNPPFRYPIGNFEQVLSIYVKRLLPSKWYSAVLRSYYKVY